MRQHLQDSPEIKFDCFCSDVIHKILNTWNKILYLSQYSDKAMG